MPRGDRTGPQGKGQLSGRQLGYCAGYDVPDYSQGGFFGFGSGQARGRAMGGRGRAVRCGPGRGGRLSASGFGAVPVPPADEVSKLRAQMNGIEKTLAALGQQLETVVRAAEE